MDMAEKEKKPIGPCEGFNPQATMNYLDPMRDKDMINYMSERMVTTSMITSILADSAKLYTEDGVKSLYGATDGLKAILEKYANIDKTRSAAMKEKDGINDLYKTADIVYLSAMMNLGAQENVAKMNAEIKAEEAKKAESDSKKLIEGAKTTADSLASLKKYYDGRNKGK
jgi:hypothetical protein